MAYEGGETRLEEILTPSQNAILNQMIGQLQQSIGKGTDVYAGQIVPGASTLQQQAFTAGSNLGVPIQGAYTTALSGAPAYEIDPAARERAYNAVEAQTLGQFQKELPYLEERYNAMGAGRSGGLQHAMAQAAGDVSLGLGALRGQYEYQDEQARRAALESAAGRQFQAAQGGLTGLASLGQTQREITGQQLGETYNKWLMGQPYSNPWLGFLPQVLGTQVQTPVTTRWGFSL